MKLQKEFREKHQIDNKEVKKGKILWVSNNPENINDFNYKKQFDFESLDGDLEDYETHSIDQN